MGVCRLHPTRRQPIQINGAQSSWNLWSNVVGHRWYKCRGGRQIENIMFLDYQKVVEPRDAGCALVEFAPGRRA